MDGLLICRRPTSGTQRRASLVIYEAIGGRIHEDATRWLWSLSRRSVTHQRNSAYSLVHWLQFCRAADINYQYATEDDLGLYIDAQTRDASDEESNGVSPGTIRQRVGAISRYYEHGHHVGWNLIDRPGGSFEGSPAHEASTTSKPVGDLTRTLRRIGSESMSLAPKSGRPELKIRPLTPFELTKLFERLEEGSSGGSRDRLVAEWLVYVGLRICEVLGDADKPGLLIGQIRQPDVNAAFPFDHVSLRVMGKGLIEREVSIPAWLILKTRSYLGSERAQSGWAVGDGDSLFVKHRHLANGGGGMQITHRRYQEIFSQACISAGLTIIRPHRKRVTTSAHSPHDLRHTYAVMTYFAELEQGNPEPWKTIQAQLGHSHLQTTIDTYLTATNTQRQWRTKFKLGSIREHVGLSP